MEQVGNKLQHYSAAFVRKGQGGWGRGLLVQPTETRNKVISVTGGGIHPVAQRIADITGAIVVDGFRTGVPDDEVLCAVINCGGTARLGVYPRKGILTIDVYPGSPGGPLAQYITEDLMVSGVTPDDVQPADGQSEIGYSGGVTSSVSNQPGTDRQSSRPVEDPRSLEPAQKGFLAAFSKVFVSLGSTIGLIVNTLLASGRQAITITINTVLPFMAYVSLLLGFVLYTGLATDLGKTLRPLSSSIIGLVLIGFITALPFLSPILGPGAAVAQVIGILLGTEIALGNIPVAFALPALFAIDGQVGCDFIPVGLGLGEAQPETVAVGVPAVLFSRVFTSPLAVVLGWVASVGLK